jgi:hypothetical protein
MGEKAGRQRRRFHAHETERTSSLDGALLATFAQRVLGFGVDVLIAVIIWAPLEFAWRHYLLHEEHVDLKWDFHEVGNILVMLLYLGLANYFGNGRTRGADGFVAVGGAGAWLWRGGA